MKNIFCISNIELKRLIDKKHMDRLLACVEKFKDTYTIQEMATQMESEEGSFGEAMTLDNVKFASKTANVEIMVACDLSEFYFPNATTQICFEVKRGFSANTALSYDVLVANLENDTHIDCAIKSGKREFNFQIKRYPQPHRTHTSEAVVEYIKETMNSYGNMNGTILIILLQPNTENPNDDLIFIDIHKGVMSFKDKISFDEIDVIFNNIYQQVLWHQVYPKSSHAKKPLVLLSEKYQKIQEKWKDKLL